MKFKDLAIGQTFDFIAPVGYNSFFNTCEKTSTRKYRWVNPVQCSLSPAKYLESRVGSVNVAVYHVNENQL